MTRLFEVATLAVALVFSGTSAALAQEREQDRNNQDRGRNNQNRHDKFDDKDRQTTNDWYNQQKAHPPVGFRDQDRLNAEQEQRLHEGAALDRDLRSRVHNAPPDLRQRLPTAPRGYRYVTIGGHVVLVDRNNQIKDVIHLHENH